jgi:hypothetical protein
MMLIHPHIRLNPLQVKHLKEIHSRVHKEISHQMMIEIQKHLTTIQDFFLD